MGMKYPPKRREFYKKVGAMCQEWRRTESPYSQFNVAYDLKTTEQAISRFEHSGVDSEYILLWYLRNGLPLERVNELWQKEHDTRQK